MPSAETKFQAIIVGVLVPCVVVGVVKLAPFLSGLTKGRFAAAVAVAALASAGVYRGLVAGLNWLLRRSEYLKKLILGPSYLHGTWVGWYGPENDVRYVVEVIEQTLTSLVTRGMAFGSDGEPRGEWHSEATMLDEMRGRLVYTCNADFASVGTPIRSVVAFNFERDAAAAPPQALYGHVTDVHDGKRTPIREVKETNRLLGFQEALPKARQKREREHVYV